jgi:hypothetical protein
MECRVIQVIETNLMKRGKGVEGDPVRTIKQYYSLDGELLWEVDQWENEQKKAEAKHNVSK